MVIKKEAFIEFLRKCSSEDIYGIDEVIVPSKNRLSNNGDTYLCEINDCEDIDFGSYRSVDPVKILFYLSRTNVFLENQNPKKRIIAGIKNCDLKALEITDQALLKENFVDPNYKYWRDNTILISSDCENLGESCHCSVLGGQPYVITGFDINLSSIDDIFSLTAGSEKGEEFLEQMIDIVSVEGSNQEKINNIEIRRQRLKEQLIRQNKQYAFPSELDKIRLISEDPWKDESLECVGCGACTNICPTCYCIILNDESEANKFVKVRSYDSCQYNGYAKVAGGGTPRPKMFQRFRNRYLCKFDYMKSNFNNYGCTACGRCSDACPAGIDFMSVVTKVANLTESV